MIAPLGIGAGEIAGSWSFRRSIFRSVVFAGSVLFITVALSCTAETVKRDGIVIAESRTYEAGLYRQNCAICHGKEAFGKQVDGLMVPGLRFGEARKKTEAEIYSQISHGKRPMPSFKDQLTDSEIKKMARFIKTELQGRD